MTREIAERFNVPESLVSEIVRSGLNNGFTLEVALIGARFALALELEQQEFFTVEEVSTVTGEPIERIKEMFESGQLAGMSIRLAPWLDA